MFDAFKFAAGITSFVLYLTTLQSIGLTLCLAIFGKQLSSIHAETKRYVFSLALIAIIASFVDVALKGATLAGDWLGILDQDILGLLWQTSVGSATMLRIFGLLFLIACLLLSILSLWLIIPVGIVALSSFAIVGHVGSLEQHLLQAVLLLHLIVAAFWIGILRPLSHLLSHDENLSVAAELGHRFGQIAAYLVPVLIIAGFLMAYILIGSVSALLSSGYGLLLLGKIGLVAILIMLAAFNKLRFVPDIRAGDGLAAQKLVQSIRLEWLAFFAILMITSLLTTSLSPPA